MKKIAKYLIIEKVESNLYYLRMTPEMQDDIGTIGFLQFKNTDKAELKANDEFASLEASKAVLTLKMPLDAKVVEWNEAAKTDPKLISSADDKLNWIMKLSDIEKDVFEALEDF
ncbi:MULTISPECIES: glycine cleavage system protein H [unclassified Mycoplasma]|uniref:glycine cleavage system protein H n=1 Tax=unclassified Mycoplasma TaxID=2683645 RepID=UPI00216B53A2|nr:MULTISPECIES: glycine cleavage system protein H [unclassified Mycoplasma]MCS4536934.1 glycine cleavage system protein H [Mycoplasma sp. CSL7475-4]MCT4469464.1 glycine cleavage system protein H [Mycoplasma sp. HS2188]